MEPPELERCPECKAYVHPYAECPGCKRNDSHGFWTWASCVVAFAMLILFFAVRKK